MSNNRQVPAVLLKLKIRANYNFQLRRVIVASKKLSMETESTNAEKAFSCPRRIEGIKKHVPTANNVEPSSKRPANSFSNA